MIESQLEKNDSIPEKTQECSSIPETVPLDSYSTYENLSATVSKSIKSTRQKWRKLNRRCSVDLRTGYIFCFVDRNTFWFSLGSFYFRIPKSEDHFTGHRFEISSNGFLHVIGNRLVRALKVFFGGTGNRKCLKKNHTLTLKMIGFEIKCQFFRFLLREIGI